MPPISPRHHNHPPVNDHELGFESNDDFTRFEQRNDIFSRAFWDETMRSADSDAFFASYRMEATPKSAAGFSQKDSALRNAAWEISNMVLDRKANEGVREGFQAPIEIDVPVAADQSTGQLYSQSWL